MIKNKGFTLIELMVVIAIIAALSAIVLAALSGSRARGNDTKTIAQLKSMVSQAQVYTGTNTAVAATATAITYPGGVAGGTLFTDTNATNSLYKLTNSLPTGTVVYYASNAVSPLAGGFWAFAASTSLGSFCVDYTGVGRSQNTTVMTTATSPGASSAPILYPNLAASYICN